MKHKLARLMIALATVLALGAVFTACGDGTVPTPAPQPTTYTVTYDLDGGKGTLPTESAKAAGAKFNLASSTGLTKTGYTFDKWNDGTTDYAAGAEYTMPEKNVTIKAVWKADEQEPATTYTVTYDLDGGKGTLPTESAKAAGAKFNLASNDGLTKTGYTFDKWNDGTTDYAAGAEYTMPEKNVTIKAVWKIVEVSENTIEFIGECEIPPQKLGLVQFDGCVVVGIKIDGAAGKAYYKLQDGDWKDCTYFENESDSKWKPDNYGANAYYYEIKIETISHYILISPDETKLYLCDSDDTPLDNGEFELKIDQPEGTFAVSFIKPQGVEGTKPAVTFVQENGKYTLPESPFTKEGWTFYKWQISGESNLRKANTQYTVNGNITLTPVFQKTYSGDLYESNLILADNGKAYLKGGMSDSLLGEYERNGDIAIVPHEYYGSVGLYLDDVTGTYTMLDGMQNFEFTAKDGTTKLTFDGKGGAMLGTTACTYVYEYNEDTNENTIKLTVGGKTTDILLEFDASYNATINVKITVDGTDYIFGNPPVECVITYELGDGVTGDVPASVTEMSGNTITLNDGTGLAKDGHTFAGWTVKGGDGTVLKGSYVVTASVTLVSAWKENGSEPVSTYKLSEFVGEYGYADKTTAGEDIIETYNSTGATAKIFYKAKVTVSSSSGNLTVTISCINKDDNNGSGSASTTKDGFDADGTAGNNVIAETTTSENSVYVKYHNGAIFEVKFTKDSDGTRKITIILNGQSVTWTEMTA